MGAPAFNVRNFIIPADTSLRIEATGAFVSCIQSSDDFLLSIDDGAECFFEAGLSYRVDHGQELYKSLRIRNPSGSSLSITLAYGRGEFFDNRSIFAGTQNVKEVIPNALNTQADVAVANTTAVKVFNGAAAAVEVIICNPSLSYEIRAGDSNVGAARGLIIPRGGSVKIVTSAEVWVYQASGASMSIPAAWTTR